MGDSKDSVEQLSLERYFLNNLEGIGSALKERLLYAHPRVSGSSFAEVSKYKRMQLVASKALTELDSVAKAYHNYLSHLARKPSADHEMKYLSHRIEVLFDTLKDVALDFRNSNELNNFKKTFLYNMQGIAYKSSHTRNRGDFNKKIKGLFLDLEQFMNNVRDMKKVRDTDDSIDRYSPRLRIKIPMLSGLEIGDLHFRDLSLNRRPEWWRELERLRRMAAVAKNKSRGGLGDRGVRGVNRRVRSDSDESESVGVSSKYNGDGERKRDLEFRPHVQRKRSDIKSGADNKHLRDKADRSIQENTLPRGRVRSPYDLSINRSGDRPKPGAVRIGNKKTGKVPSSGISRPRPPNQYIQNKSGPRVSSGRDPNVGPGPGPSPGPVSRPASPGGMGVVHGPGSTLGPGPHVRDRQHSVRSDGGAVSIPGIGLSDKKERGDELQQLRSLDRRIEELEQDNDRLRRQNAELIQQKDMSDRRAREAEEQVERGRRQVEEERRRAGKDREGMEARHRQEIEVLNRNNERRIKDMEREQKRLQDQISQKETEKERLQEMLKSKDGRLKDAESELRTLGTSLKQLQSENEEFNITVERYRRRIGDLEQVIGKLQDSTGEDEKSKFELTSRLHKLQVLHRSLESKLEHAQSKENLLQKKVDELTAQVNQFKGENINLLRELQQTSKDNERYRNDFAKQADEISKLREQLEAERRKSAGLTRDLEARERDKKYSASDSRELADKNNQLTRDNSTLHSEIEKLQRQLQTAQAEKERDRGGSRDRDRTGDDEWRAALEEENERIKAAYGNLQAEMDRISRDLSAERKERAAETRRSASENQQVRLLLLDRERALEELREQNRAAEEAGAGGGAVRVGSIGGADAKLGHDKKYGYDKEAAALKAKFDAEHKARLAVEHELAKAIAALEELKKRGELTEQQRYELNVLRYVYHRMGAGGSLISSGIVKSPDPGFKPPF